MKPIGKRIVTVFLLIFIIFHFICILIYSSPYKLNGLLNSSANRYCYPFFHQQWTVFVPAPHKRFDLYIRNGKNNVWQNWINITENLIKKNRRNRLVGREAEVLLVTNSITYVCADLGEQNLVFNKKPNFSSFKVLEQAAKYYFRNYRCWREGKNYELLLITRSQKKRTVYYFKNLTLL